MDCKTNSNRKYTRICGNSSLLDEAERTRKDLNHQLRMERLQTVREQSKKLASNLRRNVSAEKQRQCQRLEVMKAQELECWRQHAIAERDAHNSSALFQIGGAHRAAQCENAETKRRAQQKLETAKQFRKKLKAQRQNCDKPITCPPIKPTSPPVTSTCPPVKPISPPVKPICGNKIPTNLTTSDEEPPCVSQTKRKCNLVEKNNCISDLASDSDTNIDLLLHLSSAEVATKKAKEIAAKRLLEKAKSKKSKAAPAPALTATAAAATATVTTTAPATTTTMAKLGCTPTVLLDVEVSSDDSVLVESVGNVRDIHPINNRGFDRVVHTCKEKTQRSLSPVVLSHYKDRRSDSICSDKVLDYLPRFTQISKFLEKTKVSKSLQDVGTHKSVPPTSSKSSPKKSSNVPQNSKRATPPASPTTPKSSPKKSSVPQKSSPKKSSVPQNSKRAPPVSPKKACTPSSSPKKSQKKKTCSGKNTASQTSPKKTFCVPKPPQNSRVSLPIKKSVPRVEKRTTCSTQFPSTNRISDFNRTSLKPLPECVRKTVPTQPSVVEMPDQGSLVNSGRVQFYNYDNKFSKEYDAGTPATMIYIHHRECPQPNAREAASVERERMELREEEKQKQNDICEERGQLALQREQARRDCESLINKLDALDKNKLCLPTNAGLKTYQQCENARIFKEAKMNKIMENYLSNPAVLTCAEINDKCDQINDGVRQPVEKRTTCPVINVGKLMPNLNGKENERKQENISSDSCCSVLLDYLNDQNKLLRGDITVCKGKSGCNEDKTEKLRSLLRRTDNLRLLLTDQLAKGESAQNDRANKNNLKAYFDSIDDMRQERDTIMNVPIKNVTKRVGTSKPDGRSDSRKSAPIANVRAKRSPKRPSKDKAESPAKRIHSIGSTTNAGSKIKSSKWMNSMNYRPSNGQMEGTRKEKILALRKQLAEEIKLQYEESKDRKRQQNEDDEMLNIVKEIMKNNYVYDKQPSKGTTKSINPQTISKLPSSLSKGASNRQSSKLPYWDHLSNGCSDQQQPQEQQNQQHRQQEMYNSYDSTSTAYRSLPSKINEGVSVILPVSPINTSEDTPVPMQQQGAPLINPLIANYVQRLLVMSQDAIEKLPVSSSEMDSITSSVVNVSSNVLPVGVPQLSEQQLRRIERFIDENRSFICKLEDSLRAKEQSHASLETNMKSFENIWKKRLAQFRTSKAPPKTLKASVPSTNTRNQPEVGQSDGRERSQRKESEQNERNRNRQSFPTKTKDHTDRKLSGKSINPKQSIERTTVNSFQGMSWNRVKDGELKSSVVRENSVGEYRAKLVQKIPSADVIQKSLPGRFKENELEEYCTRKKETRHSTSQGNNTRAVAKLRSKENRPPQPTQSTSTERPLTMTKTTTTKTTILARTSTSTTGLKKDATSQRRNSVGTTECSMKVDGILKPKKQTCFADPVVCACYEPNPPYMRSSMPQESFGSSPCRKFAPSPTVSPMRPSFIEIHSVINGANELRKKSSSISQRRSRRESFKESEKKGLVSWSTTKVDAIHRTSLQTKSTRARSTSLSKSHVESQIKSPRRASSTSPRRASSISGVKSQSKSPPRRASSTSPRRASSKSRVESQSKSPPRRVSTTSPRLASSKSRVELQSKLPPRRASSTSPRRASSKSRVESQTKSPPRRASSTSPTKAQSRSSLRSITQDLFMSTSSSHSQESLQKVKDLSTDSNDNVKSLLTLASEAVISNTKLSTLMKDGGPLKSQITSAYREDRINQLNMLINRVRHEKLLLMEMTYSSISDSLGNSNHKNSNCKISSSQSSLSDHGPDPCAVHGTDPCAVHGTDRRTCSSMTKERQCSSMPNTEHVYAHTYYEYPDSSTSPSKSYNLRMNDPSLSPVSRSGTSRSPPTGTLRKHRATGQSRDSGISMTRPLTALEIFLEITGPDPESLASTVAQSTANENENDNNANRNAALTNRPPSTLRRYSPHLPDLQVLEAHELSTIIEVETPAPSRINTTVATPTPSVFNAQTFPSFEEFSRQRRLQLMCASPERSPQLQAEFNDILNCVTTDIQKDIAAYQEFPSIAGYLNNNNNLSYLEQSSITNRNSTLMNAREEIAKEMPFLYNMTAEPFATPHEYMKRFTTNTPERDILDTASLENYTLGSNQPICPHLDMSETDSETLNIEEELMRRNLITEKLDSQSKAVSPKANAASAMAEIFGESLGQGSRRSETVQQRMLPRDSDKVTINGCPISSMTDSGDLFKNDLKSLDINWPKELYDKLEKNVTKNGSQSQSQSEPKEQSGTDENSWNMESYSYVSTVNEFHEMQNPLNLREFLRREVMKDSVNTSSTITDEDSRHEAFIKTIMQSMMTPSLCNSFDANVLNSLIIAPPNTRRSGIHRSNDASTSNRTPSTIQRCQKTSTPVSTPQVSFKISPTRNGTRPSQNASLSGNLFSGESHLSSVPYPD